MAYCEKMQRIGAIINNMGIVFWEGSDHFQSEKLISKSIGDKIYYLQFFDEWVTTDKNVAYFWDLKDEIVTRTIKKDDAVSINDITEITHLRSICMSYTSKNDKKSIVIYH
eukprot:GHVR01055347.1.p1 GENE.GHVR01055347.1~~GHVR01055347.1.p1  ORF type:complete len:111 (+),score=7.12 GHVR01055347.1:239-571(+)